MDHNPELIPYVIGFTIVLGLLQAFFGYRIFKVVLAILSFVVCASMAVELAAAHFDNQMVVLGCGLVAGLIGAALASVFFFIGVFVAGFVFGGVVANAFLALGDGANSSPAMILAGVAGGVLAVIFKRLAIIIATAFGGAWSVVAGAVYFFLSIDVVTNPQRLNELADRQVFPILGAWLVLGVVGMMYQLRPDQKSAAAGAGGDPAE